MDTGRIEQSVINTDKIEQSVSATLVDAGYSTDDCKDDNADDRVVDVIGIAQGLGFVVGNAVLNEDDDGFIVVDESRKEIFGIKTDKLIGVNSNRTLEWKRFIIAHEIGHYILDFKEKNLEGLYANRYHSKGHSRRENAVDFFAASLLMPKNGFRSKYNEIKKKCSDSKEIVKELAKHFVVTVRMAERRVKELGLE